MPTLVLASASSGRLGTLRRAGIEPLVVVSGVDEDVPPEMPAVEVAAVLAERKATAVADRVSPDLLVVGCDSVLELDGRTLGKPTDADDAVARWREMRGRSGVLHTGHHLVHRSLGQAITQVGSTVVHFAELTDAEIDAYVASGEPLHVAGAFTLDGLGGAYVTGVEGDPHNVVGISLPTLRTMLAEIGVPWHRLWSGSRPLAAD